MQPVLFSFLGLDIQTYGVSKAAAALVGAWLLGRAFARRGLLTDDAHAVVLWATVWGFAGAKAYFLLEHVDDLTWHHLGGAGFTWYGGLLGGIAAALVVVRRRQLPLAVVADEIAAPLSIAYAIGRVGCWLSGDGTYGRPTSLPWGMPVTDGLVPTEVAVHPTPLYEALAAVAIGVVLWRLGRRGLPTLAVAASYLALSGVARFAVEYLRTNEQVLLGFTQPQLWSIASVLGAAVLVVVALRHDRPARDRGQRPSSNLDGTPVGPVGPHADTDTVATQEGAPVSAAEPRRTAVTLIHSPACHFCDDAGAALADLAAGHPIDVSVVAIDSPEGAALVARHRPAMNPLVLVDGEFFSSGRLPRKKLIRLLTRRAQEPATAGQVI